MRTKHGDNQAYGELVRTYQRLAFRTAYLITGSASDAEDVTQEGFLKAYNAIHRFRIGSPFRPWLLKIVANEARNRRKAEHRRSELTLQLEQGRSSGDSALSPEAFALRRESRESLLQAVKTLRDEERLVVFCRYFLELSEQETAQVVGVRRGTVKSRTSRALDRIRAHIESLGEELVT